MLLDKNFLMLSFTALYKMLSNKKKVNHKLCTSKNLTKTSKIDKSGSWMKIVSLWLSGGDLVFKPAPKNLSIEQKQFLTYYLMIKKKSFSKKRVVSIATCIPCLSLKQVVSWLGFDQFRDPSLAPSCCRWMWTTCKTTPHKWWLLMTKTSKWGSAISYSLTNTVCSAIWE